MGERAGQSRSRAFAGLFTSRPFHFLPFSDSSGKQSHERYDARSLTLGSLFTHAHAERKTFRIQKVYTHVRSVTYFAKPHEPHLKIYIYIYRIFISFLLIYMNYVNTHIQNIVYLFKNLMQKKIYAFYVTFLIHHTCCNIPHTSKHENIKHALFDHDIKYDPPVIGGIHPCARREGRSPCERTLVCGYIRVCMCMRVCMCTCAREWKNRVTHDAYARQCMLALLPFLASPPHLSHPRATRLSVYVCTYVCIMETRHASWRRVIYPLLFAFAGRQRTEKKSTIVLHGLARGTAAVLLSIYNCHYDRVRRFSFTHNRQFAFRIWNVHNIAAQTKMSAILIPPNSTINRKNNHLGILKFF